MRKERPPAEFYIALVTACLFVALPFYFATKIRDYGDKRAKPPPAHVFVLGQGETMFCDGFEATACGMLLFGCGTGRVEFECIVGVTYVGVRDRR